MSSFSFVESLLALFEKYYAWRASRAMLTWYRRVRREESLLFGAELYEQILIRRSGLDSNQAAAILGLAEDSFCRWPAARQVRYRDVVTYIVVEEYLRSHHAIRATQTDMSSVVFRVIPREL